MGEGSGVAVSCGVGCRRSLDPTVRWLWLRPVTTAAIRPLAWEPLYAVGSALKTNKQKLFSHSSGGWTLQIKVGKARLPLKAQRKNSSLPLPSLWGLPASLGILQPAVTLFLSLPLISSGVPCPLSEQLHVSVFSLPLLSPIKTPVTGNNSLHGSSG